MATNPVRPDTPDGVSFFSLDCAAAWKTWRDIPPVFRAGLRWCGFFSLGHGTSTKVWFVDYAESEGCLQLLKCVIGTSQIAEGIRLDEQYTFQPVLLLAGSYNLLARPYKCKEGEAP